MPDAISLGDALKKFLAKSRFKYNIQAFQIEDHWEKVMGQTIAKFTDKLEIRDGTLFIQTEVAPLKTELVFQKSLIIERINESVGEKMIRDVVIL
jgi:predicted nucleic acid-binding Zn ribbon protein